MWSLVNSLYENELFGNPKWKYCKMSHCQMIKEAHGIKSKHSGLKMNFTKPKSKFYDAKVAMKVLFGQI